ncbi:hypothetical protein F4821DRAFT_278153 [Hypoxylon rubiginosum]|uniref:Uncharacterized protein n=1 Tax=Hypoxylon rubiginosum TaxID=110542 RepID=A0ACC0D409_9PEZI|nr:hypothetical protein F4821DRAFT_278153 [Hypoxylon rubiginosum]
MIWEDALHSQNRVVRTDKLFRVDCRHGAPYQIALYGAKTSPNAVIDPQDELRRIMHAPLPTWTSQAQHFPTKTAKRCAHLWTAHFGGSHFAAGWQTNNGPPHHHKPLVLGIHRKPLRLGIHRKRQLLHLRALLPTLPRLSHLTMTPVQQQKRSRKETPRRHPPTHLPLLFLALFHKHFSVGTAQFKPNAVANLAHTDKHRPARH